MSIKTKKDLVKFIGGNPIYKAYFQKYVDKDAFIFQVNSGSTDYQLLASKLSEYIDQEAQEAVELRAEISQENHSQLRLFMENKKLGLNRDQIQKVMNIGNNRLSELNALYYKLENLKKNL
jgi:hypothetical protein